MEGSQDLANIQQRQKELHLLMEQQDLKWR
jgi:hypothetical protein